MADSESSDDEVNVEDDSDSHTCTSSVGISQNSKRKRKDSKFVDSWLEVKEFKGWLVKKRGTDGSIKPYCNICQLEINSTKTGIQRHMDSAKHQRKIQSTKGSQSLSTLFKRNSFENQRKVIEVKLCAFIAEHNLPISLVESFVELLKSLFPDDKPLARVRLGKQKATNVIRQVLGFDYIREATKLLRAQRFSTIIDETTDVSTRKQLAIMACYFDTKCFQSKQILLDMVEVEDSTAAGIYSAFKGVFQTLNIPMVNIIGYSSDTTNVMFGAHNSVSQLLKTDVRHVHVVKCSCHLIHLASSYAALKLPKSLEDLCRDVYAHFSRSSRRQDTYKEFQNFFEVEPHKLLSPGQTRWLSLGLCVNRILEQYDALKHYFVLVSTEDPTHTNDRIKASLFNKFTRAYLEFLAYQLERFNDFNKLFQCERPLLQSLRGQVEKLIKGMASDFMDVKYVKSTPAEEINPEKIEKYVPLGQVYTGLMASQSLQEIKAGANPNDVQMFLHDCRNFLIEGIIQVKQRFDLKQEILDIVECTLPENAFNLKPPSLHSIAMKLPYLKDMVDLNELDLQWRKHPFEDGLNSTLTWEEYWLKVKNAKLPSGDLKYPQLITFLGLMASFPFSNVVEERLFSLLKQVKSECRNRLSCESLVPLLQSKLGMKNLGCSAASLPVDSMLELMSNVKANAKGDEVRKLKEEFCQKI